MKIYKIFRSTMAAKLTRAGFQIIGTEPNMRRPQLDVFLFEDTPEFREVLTKLSNN